MNKMRFLVMDVDGTLTNGKIYMGENGELFKAFDIKDGCGIKDILPQMGIIPVIITARSSQMLENRCRELGIVQFYQGERDKIGRLREILAETSSQDGCMYGLENVAYIGDDILDLQCMLPVKEAGGLVACPADAVKKVMNVADFVSVKNGGNGAVRELIDWMNESMSADECID